MVRNECVTYFTDMLITLDFRKSYPSAIVVYSDRYQTVIIRVVLNIIVEKFIYQRKFSRVNEFKREKKFSKLYYILRFCLKTKLNTTKSKAFKSFKVKC